MSKSCKRGLASRLKWLTSPLAFARHQGGTAALEYGLIALPFLALLMATVQTAVVTMAQQELETAVEQAGRLVLTGQVQNDTQTQFATAVCNQLHTLFNCSNLMIDMTTVSSFASASTSAPTLTFNAKGQVTNTWSFQPGVAGSIEVLQVMYQWPVFGGLLGFNLSNLSNGNRLLMATSVFKNEP
jgi:Flp pilus assembly protein TadG